MNQSTVDDRSLLLVHAYLDGELDPVNALAISQQLQDVPALSAEERRIRALRQRLKDLPRERAPNELRSRVESLVARSGTRSASPGWRALAASILVTAVISSSSVWILAGSQQASMTENVLVSDHIRSLMAQGPVDVASSDRHTVKPWFNGKISESPRVVDLAKSDFPLVGGRVDVIDRTPVPTLVYRRAKHLISLTAIPAGHRAGLDAKAQNIDGYNVVHWTENGITYWAISDLAVKELDEFAHLFRTSDTEL